MRSPRPRISGEQLARLTARANARIDELFERPEHRALPMLTAGMVRIVLDVEGELVAETDAETDGETDAETDGETDGETDTPHPNGPPVVHPVVEQAMREIARAVERHEHPQPTKLDAEQELKRPARPATVRKSEFVGIRMSEDEFDTVMAVAAAAGKPGNISAGVRAVIDGAAIALSHGRSARPRGR